MATATAEPRKRKPNQTAETAQFTEQPPQQSEVSRIEYPVAMTVIADLQQMYSGLTIAGVDDKAGLLAVDEARKEVKRLKIQVENRRKELKADALEYGRKVDAAAKTLSEPLEALEALLAGRQKLITDEQARIEQQKQDELFASRRDRLAAYAAEVPERILRIMREDEFNNALCAAQAAHEEKLRRDAEQAKVDQRLAKLRAVNCIPDRDLLGLMPDDRFEQVLVEATQADLNEKQRQADEADRQRLEREQLEEDRKKLEADREELAQAHRAQAEKDAEVRGKIDEENRRLASQVQEKIDGRTRQVMLCHADPTAYDLANMTEAEFVELVTRLSQEDAARIQREADEYAQRREQQRLDDEAADKKEQQRIEALRSDKEKLLKFAKELFEMDVPEVGDNARLLRALIVDRLKTFGREIAKLVEERLN